MICKTTEWWVCEKEKNKKSSWGDYPLLEDDGPGRHGGEVDGRVVKSYFSGLRELCHQAPPVGPPLKPARQDEGVHLYCRKCRGRHEQRWKRVKTICSLFSGLHWGEESCLWQFKTDPLCVFKSRLLWPDNVFWLKKWPAKNGYCGMTCST